MAAFCLRNRAIGDSPLLLDLHHQRIQIKNDVGLLQWPPLPGQHFFDHAVCATPDQFRRDLHAVDLLQMPLNLAGGHSTRVEGDDLSSKLSNRGCRFLTKRRSNSPLRSRGTSIGISPCLPLNVFRSSSRISLVMAIIDPFPEIVPGIMAIYTDFLPPPAITFFQFDASVRFILVDTNVA